MNPGEADAALRRAFVSVRDGGEPVGAGVLITDTLILTCAHVVNSALGRDRFTTAPPAPGDTVAVRMPYVSGERETTGRVVRDLWCPPRARPDGGGAPAPGAFPYHGDLAVLEFAAPDGAEPAPFLPQSEGGEVIALWASGHELTTVRAVSRVAGRPWLALDVVGGAVDEGHSGGPLWDRARQAVIGVVVAAHRAVPNGASHVRQTLYGVGLPVVEAELPLLPPVAVPMAQRGRQQLLGALRGLLPGTRAAVCEERLASRLGRASAGAAADVHRLVGMALGVRRGVPELLDVVHEFLADHPAADPTAAEAHRRGLRRAAELVSPGELLTTLQRRDLTGLLTQCRATDPMTLLRTTLPHAEEWPPVAGLVEATEVLEGFDAPADRPAPPLLQGVVRVALAERAGQETLADDLDAWVTWTADVLGVGAAVDRFRADLAQETGAVHADVVDKAVPRVQVELFADPQGRRFTYQMWVWSPDGRHDVVRAQDTPVPRAHVVEDIRGVLRTEVDERCGKALVEFFVAPASLRLDVDTWAAAAGEDDAGFHLGLNRGVVLRSARRTRETYVDWKRRTEALVTAERLVLDHRAADPTVARARLEEAPEAGVVVVACAQDRQGPVLRQCLQAGVHTVLWHRDEHGARVAERLAALLHGVGHADIPEAVRGERVRALADPGGAPDGASLSLLHDGPDHRPPLLAPDPWVLTQP
ncbi:trypsin-like peptidase domain-containing protein [Streptomyces sp. NPDC052114]|uniref:VMAP-C domain-containing protein n=1 Tax=unclassified Streptomyces TaxID=2593676 RepID=UPI00342C033F